MKRKVNPRRRPATEADVRKAKDAAVSVAIDAAWAIFFTVLRDKEGMENNQLRRIWDCVNDLSDSIARGYVSVKDLMTTLKEEAGLAIGYSGKGAKNEGQ